MRKIFCLILLAGLLAFGSTAFAAEKYKLPDGSRATLVLVVSPVVIAGNLPFQIDLM